MPYGVWVGLFHLTFGSFIVEGQFTVVTVMGNAAKINRWGGKSPLRKSNGVAHGQERGGAWGSHLRTQSPKGEREICFRAERR